MAAGDKKISELDLVTTLATTAQIPALNNGSTIRVTVDNVLNDTNNRFWLNDAGTLAYDTFGNSFGRFHVFSGNTWVSGANKWLECPNFRANGSGYVFQLIGGGSTNHVNNSTSSSTVGGLGNNTYADYSIVGNGTFNIISGDYSVIGGGDSNESFGDFSVIAGGITNSSKSDYAVIAGGTSNVIPGTSLEAAIGGGSSNYATGTAATVAGGYDNTAYSNYAFVGGGSTNSCSGVGGVTVGGYNNRAGRGTTYPVIVGGTDNSIVGASSEVSAIVGGQTNLINNSLYSFIGAGYGNQVIVGSYDAVLGGDSNITSGDYSSCLGGKSNFSNTDYNLTWGLQSFAVHDGATVLSDKRAIAVGNKYSKADNSFNLYYDGGAYLSGTPLYVLGAETYASGKFAIGMKNVPASSTAVGRAGEITFNTNTGFFCVDTNTWKSIPLSSFGSDTNVSNIYGITIGSGVADYSLASVGTDDTWQNIGFDIQAVNITVPATAGTANYFIDAIIKYKGSPDTWGFRFHDGTSVVSNSTVTRYTYTISEEKESTLRAIYSTTASKTISLQALAQLGNTHPAFVITGTQISYLRLT